ncbi:MAG: hypothetical protein WCD66_04525 [Rhodanobacteraceae bacterium]
MRSERTFAHFERQDWTAILIELGIVVVGVFIGLQVDNWNQARQERQRLTVLVQGMSADLHDFDQVQERFARQVTRGLAAFKAARARGEELPPYYKRMPGSDTPPDFVFKAAMQAGLADLVDPKLMFDLGFYYSEREGIGAKYTRYAQFVDSQILPRLGDPSSFYDASGALKPAFAQNMDRLHEWIEYSNVLVRSSKCLQRRLKHPQKPGESCRPDYGDAPQ